MKVRNGRRAKFKSVGEWYVPNRQQEQQQPKQPSSNLELLYHFLLVSIREGE